MSAVKAQSNATAADLATPESRKRLEDYLAREAHAERASIDDMRVLSGGAIQENWALGVLVEGGPHAGRHAWVLRTDSASSVSVSLDRTHEYDVLRVAHAAGAQAPRPLWLCRDRTLIGREFFVMERLPGIAAGHRITRDKDLVPDGAVLARELGANLARLHEVTPPNAELAFLPLPAGNPVLASIAEYRRHLDELSAAYPALEWGLRWCERHAPDPIGPTFLHRDYRTGNYLVDRGHLAGVLDWEFAGWGDPREDIGWFTARCWRFNGPELEGGGIASVEPFLRGYESVSRLRITRDDLHLWQVMAHLRWAVIALQQARRHNAWGERSLELALTGRIVHELEYEVLRMTSKDHR